MLTKPEACRGCPLDTLGSGFMEPVFARLNPYLVSLVGEALGKDESEEGKPFVGKAGLRLTRLIEWAGLKRESFDIFNTVFCRPPDNKLEGEWYEAPAIEHCKSKHWGHLAGSNRVLVPMGNVAQNAFIGKKGILSTRGYVYPGPENSWIIPTVHPSFIQRGQSRWSAAFINDIQKAVELAKNGMPPQVQDYTLDPTPLAALQWADGYIQELRRNPSTYIAFDIETPMKGEDEEDNDTDSDTPDRSWIIERIGFSYGPLHALSIPWEPPYFATIRLLMGSMGPKVVWNAGYDVPRIRRAGVPINGVIHDGMVAWHILHSDLPKKLGFVATFTCPWQPAWKHLSGARPAFYNATDADVELRSMLKIEEELRKTGLWDVYQRDVLDLEPILVHMHQIGMPIDQEVRLDRAVKLATLQRVSRETMQGLVPTEARKIAIVYKNTPKSTDGLLSRDSTRLVPACIGCGLEKPRKDHFKRFVKKHNPCAGLGVAEVEKPVLEYYRLADFTPSREQLMRYHAVLKRKNPTVWDKKERKPKVSFGEEQLKKLMLDYPADLLYPEILNYRSIDKLAGTYVGRPVEG